MKNYCIKRESKVEYEIKNSRFIAFSYFVQTKKEVENIVKKHKQKYKDATHNCFGYIIKKNKEEGFFDDGEPSKTSGFPILEYLKKNNYEYTLIIVTRFFGGTLLGTGGLSRAYSDGVKKVLIESEKYIVNDGYEYIFECEYKDEGKIRYILEKNKIFIKNIKYIDKILFNILISFEDIEKLEEIKQRIRILEKKEIIVKKQI